MTWRKTEWSEKILEKGLMFSPCLIVSSIEEASWFFLSWDKCICFSLLQHMTVESHLHCSCLSQEFYETEVLQVWSSSHLFLLSATPSNFSGVSNTLVVIEKSQRNVGMIFFLPRNRNLTAGKTMRACFLFFVFGGEEEFQMQLGAF